jgi:hypothetical protein
MDSYQVVDLAAVGALGALVGAGEIVSRYRDAPMRALLCPSALFYIVFNLSAACAAYGLIHAFGWEFGAEGAETTRWTRVLVAGFGAMALFRSALFVVRIGTQDVAIGPASLLGALMNVADRGVDRARGRERAEEVSRLLKDVGWPQARTELPALCLGLMQNATALEKSALADAIRDIDAGELEDDVRVLLVGLELLNLAGIGVLTGAVGLLLAKQNITPA